MWVFFKTPDDINYLKEQFIENLIQYNKLIYNAIFIMNLYKTFRLYKFMKLHKTHETLLL